MTNDELRAKIREEMEDAWMASLTMPRALDRFANVAMRYARAPEPATGLSWLDQYRRLLQRGGEEQYALREMMNAWERATKASNMVTADRDRLFRLIASECPNLQDIIAGRVDRDDLRAREALPEAVMRFFYVNREARDMREADAVVDLLSRLGVWREHPAGEVI